MRHHAQTIVGPDLDGPNYSELPNSCPKPITGLGDNDSWGGPDPLEIDIPTRVATLEAWRYSMEKDKACPPDPVGTNLQLDPYPPDVLAACPKAREWGVRLVTDRPEPVPFVWMDGDLWWSAGEQRWCKDCGGGVRRTRAEALAAAPTTPPPGYVEPKAERSTVDRLGELAYEAWHGTTTHSPFDRMPPLTQRDFCNAAQAVRLAELEEPVTDEDADKALLEWMRRPSQERSQASMKHALSAALASRLARARKETQ